MLAQAYHDEGLPVFCNGKDLGQIAFGLEPTEGYDAETTFRPKLPSSRCLLRSADIDMALSLSE